MQDEQRDIWRALAWFNVSKRNLGTWAFALNRLTGLALTLYLLLHLGVLTLLALGEAQWDAFIALARSPVVLALDVVLIFGILYHGLNGMRVALVGMGIGVRHQKALFWGLMALAALLLAVSAWLVFII
jgi:succinate dehydrogenase / fumarate reductase cytochrome b subunit